MKNKNNYLIAVIIGSALGVVMLWLLVFHFIEISQLNDINQSFYYKIDQLSVEAKKAEIYGASDRTITLIKKNPDFSAKLKTHFGQNWTKWAELIARESSFNSHAINPSSGACGLGQALPCHKMACSLADEDCQLAWMNSYVVGRYGTIDKALEFHTNNNWY